VCALLVDDQVHMIECVVVVSNQKNVTSYGRGLNSCEGESVVIRLGYCFAYKTFGLYFTEVKTGKGLKLKYLHVSPLKGLRLPA